MADDNDAGAAYLSALRQSTKPHAASAAAPARALESHPRNVASPHNSPRADKRKSPRYPCEGSARIQEVGNNTATWAKLADISMHGCYVETATPFRLGTSLALKLDANNYRIEATGEVRVVYSGLGMGISFITMSDEDRARLRELVRSISPTSVIMNQRVFPRASTAPPPSQAVPPVNNPAAVLQAILKFFEDRHVLGREEFLKILRINH
jgi:PilZ domain-containing protein